MSVIDAGDGTYVLVDGQIVERDALHIAERIHEYDENLELVCLDPDKAGINDAPFLVLELLPNGTRTVAFEAWSLDERLLERIYNADKRRVDSLVLIDDMMKKKRLDNEKRYQERSDERKDIMLSALVNQKTTFSLKNREGDKVTIDEMSPIIKINNGKKSFHAVGNPTVRPNSRYTPPKSRVG